MEKLVICRICLDDNVRMKSLLENSDLQEVYEKLTNTPFQTNDMRPLALCYICRAQLKASHRLMVKSLKAEVLLTEMLNQIVTVTHTVPKLKIHQSPLNQLVFTEIQQISIDSEVHNVDQNVKEEIPIDYERDVKWEALSMEDLKTASSKDPESSDNEQGLSDREDPLNDITVTLEEEVGGGEEGLYELKQATPIAKKSKRKSKVNFTTKDVKNVNTNAENVRAEASKPLGLLINNTQHKNPVIHDEVQIHEKKNIKCISNNSVAGTNSALNKYFRLGLEKHNMCQQKSDEESDYGNNDDGRSRFVDNTCLRVNKKYICDVCKKTFSIKTALIVHKRTHASEKPHVCDVCTKSFARKGSLINHKQSHLGEKSYVCNICNKSFHMEQNLRAHSIVHTAGDKPYVCNVCNKSFKRKNYFKIHIRSHSGVKPYSCNICNKTFTVNSSLRAHARIHTGEKPFVCNVCPKSFRRKDHLILHTRGHTGEKPYACDICHKSFRDPSCVNIHKRTHTGAKPLVKRISHAGEKPYCDDCGKSFTAMSYLITHKRTHTGEKPYVCNVCNKSFSHITYLKAHGIVHTGDKPYVCDVCGKRFGVKGSLKSHARLHTGERPFLCNVCNKRFYRKDQLMGHTRIHTGEKPYVCDHCDRGFSQRCDIIKHIRTHTGEKLHVCNVCKKSFIHKRALTAHARTHTGDR